MTDDTADTDELNSTSAPHVFAYRNARGVPFRLTIHDLPDFGHGHGDQRYRLIDDDEVAADLREYNQTRETPVFRHTAAADLEEVLDTAKDATAAIEAGEHDDVLDLLLYAERRAFDNRVTVIDAITERKRAIEEQRQAADGSVERTTQPEDVTPAALR
jgi:hypothetical protein